MEGTIKVLAEQPRQRLPTESAIGTPQTIESKESVPKKEQKRDEEVENKEFRVVLSDCVKREDDGGRLVIQDEWRTNPGYVLEVLNKLPIPQFVHSRFAQFQVLLGRFLFNSNPSPLTDLPLFEGSSFGIYYLKNIYFIFIII